MKCRWLGMSFLAVLLGCGDSGGPTAVPFTPPTESTSVPSPAADLNVRVTDGVTGAPVAGARVEVEGVGDFTTDASGNVTFDVTQSGTSGRTILINAEGFWPRHSKVSSSSRSRSVEVLLFPSSEPFDLDFFDHVFRDLGDRGTRRWEGEPRFEIWTTRFDCIDVAESGVCEELEATDQMAPPAFVRNARTVIENHTRRYTGGAVRGSVITERAHEPGARIVHEDQADRGKISIAMVSFPQSVTTSWARTWSFTEGRATSRAHIQMNRRHLDNIGVYSHELAHTLGFRHPIGSENVPRSSIMRRGHGDEPTGHDVLHGRLLYTRPTDSTTPDTDPPRRFLNELRELVMGATETEVVDP